MVHPQQFPKIREAFDDEVYGPIQECGSKPDLPKYNFGMVVRDIHLDANRICVVNTEELSPEEASWLALCGPGRWVTARLQPTPGGIFIIDGLRIATKPRVKALPEEMRLVFNRRSA